MNKRSFFISEIKEPGISWNIKEIDGLWPPVMKPGIGLTAKHHTDGHPSHPSFDYPQGCMV